MTKQETYDYLRAHGVDFEITEHPAVFNMEECAAVDMPYPEDDAKNLLVRDDKKRSYYLITVRCGKRVDLKEFQRRHGTRRLSFASPEELLRLLQLSITYWQQTMPKTSRKQAVLLKDLLQPNLIDGQYALLLQKII